MFRWSRNFNLEVPCHQYIYNVGEKNCIIKIEDKFEERFESGDSIYLKPYLKQKVIALNVF